METTLHRQLKEMYRQPEAMLEVRLGRFRIDIVHGSRLIEVQRSSLASIRDKVRQLLQRGFSVDVVKPLIVGKRLIKLDARNGREIERRQSPLKGSAWDIFDELIYFRTLFPHPGLRLRVPLVAIGEIRYPGNGKRRRRRKNPFQVQDQYILEMKEQLDIARIDDLVRMLPGDLPEEFDTRDLTERSGLSRDRAQRIVYVLRETGGMIPVGKRGRTRVYRLATPAETRKNIPRVDRKLKLSAARELKQALLLHRSRAEKKIA
jgi:hypothetical protein